MGQMEPQTQTTEEGGDMAQLAFVARSGKPPSPPPPSPSPKQSTLVSGEAAAPKRAAKKAATRPPSPLPPAESSDETRSGSRSRSDESEDEKTIADSPVSASIPVLKNAPAPPQKGDDSESSDEEEEEEPVRAPPRNQPPPPQNKEDSDASGNDEEDDEGEEDEDEEEPARAAAPPPSDPKKHPPQPQTKEDSDTSDEEEDEEAPPPPKLAPKDAEALKPPAAAAETKKPGERIWSTADEIRILKALAAYQKEHGTLPKQDALVDLFAGKLDNASYGSKELYSKIRSLRTRYLTLSKRGELPSKEHDRQVLDLSKMVWDSDKTTPAAAAAVAANSRERKGFKEMCELYPYLAEEVKELEAARPGMCKREFGKMDDDKARAMDEKIKRQRVAQIRLEMRRSDLVKEVTKALLDLLDG